MRHYIFEEYIFEDFKHNPDDRLGGRAIIPQGNGTVPNPNNPNIGQGNGTVSRPNDSTIGQGNGTVSRTDDPNIGQGNGTVSRTDDPNIEQGNGTVDNPGAGGYSPPDADGNRNGGGYSPPPGAGTNDGNGGSGSEYDNYENPYNFDHCYDNTDGMYSLAINYEKPENYNLIKSYQNAKKKFS